MSRRLGDGPGDGKRRYGGRRFLNGILGAAMPYGVTKAETKPAEQHQAKKCGQQGAGTQRELSVTPGLNRVQLLLVENSPHTPFLILLFLS
jgi:hypothetical protein